MDGSLLADEGPTGSLSPVSFGSASSVEISGPATHVSQEHQTNRFLDQAQEDEERDEERIEGIRAEPLVGLAAAMAMETLRGVFANIGVLGNVVDEKVQEALAWADWYFESKYFEDDHGVRKERNPYNLTRDELAAIVMYTMQFALYTELNKALRSNRRAEQLQPFFRYMRLFLTALYKLPTRKMTLYRGIKEHISQTAYVEGTQTRFWAFSSATPSLSVLQEPTFLGNSGDRIQFNITGKCVDISHYSVMPDEDERLIEAGSKFKIIGALDLGNRLTQLNLEEDPDSQSPFDFLPPADRERLDELELRAYQDKVFIQEPGKNWKKLSSELVIPVSKAGPTAALAVGSIFVVGGYTREPNSETSMPTNKVQVYKDGKWDLWSFPMPLSVASHAVVFAPDGPGHLVVTGGNEYTNTVIAPTNKVQTYDFSTSLWSLHSNSMRNARAGHCARIFQSIFQKEQKLFVIGGDNLGKSVESTTLSSLSSFSYWTTEPSMNHKRKHSFASVEYLSCLYVLGGATLTVEYFNGKHWFTEKEEMKVLLHQEGINAVTYGEKIYVFGASVIQVGSMYSGDLIWEIKRQATSFWVPGQLYMTGCRLGEEYWAMGGGDRHSAPSAQVWVLDLSLVESWWRRWMWGSWR